MQCFKLFFLLICANTFNLFSPLQAQEIQTKAIIFDCDGTLIDNGNGYFLDWQYALKCQGYELSEEPFWNYVKEHNLVGNSLSEKFLVEYCCELLGYDASEALIKDKTMCYKALHDKGFPPITATIDFLRLLAAQKETLGIKIGLASAAPRAHIMRNLKHLGVEDCFDLIISGSEDLKHYNDPQGTNKPKPYIYLHAAHLLGLDPRSCVAIEDSRVGVLAGVHAGFVTVAVPNAQTKDHDLSAAHLKIDSFAPLSINDFFRLLAPHHK